ncbi:MAG: LPP20 family lipoprotein [Treponema sp.]|jgi:hypothetical protein|nr:LPP20 family lipoprotein [Treponema sp.]
MIKKSVPVLIGIVLIGFVISCFSSAPVVNADVPGWLTEIAPEAVIWGIGSAKNQTSESASRITAENRARAAIARQLNNRVQAMFTDYTQNAGISDTQTPSLQKDISRSLVNIELNNTVVNAQWRADDGTWWIRLEYKKTDAKNTLTSIFDREAVKYAEFKKDQALMMIDDQLAGKNESPLHVRE